jgi:hypothetical protein
MVPGKVRRSGSILPTALAVIRLNRHVSGNLVWTVSLKELRVRKNVYPEEKPLSGLPLTGSLFFMA